MSNRKDIAEGRQLKTLDSPRYTAIGFLSLHGKADKVYCEWNAVCQLCEL